MSVKVVICQKGSRKKIPHSDQVRSGSVLQLQGVIRLGNFHSSNVSHSQLHRSTAVQYQINQPPTAAYKTTTHDLIQHDVNMMNITYT